MNYQLRNSIGENLFECIVYENFSFSRHLHRFLELVYVLEGNLQAVIGDKEHMLQPGEMALVMPHMMHEFRAVTQNKSAVFVISSDNIPSVSKKLENTEADSYAFKPEEPVRKYFEHALLYQENPDQMAIKAAIYAVVHSYLQTHNLRPKGDANSDLLQKMISYIAQNFQEDITLQTLATELGYNSRYLSSVFNNALKINFRRFLNLYRIDHACVLLRETNMDITAISLECGFQSIRCFNRVFLDTTGEQPLKYRNRLR